MKPEVHKDEGYRLMGAAFETYNERGYGLGEEIYQACLEIELEIRGIASHAKQELMCFYKGRELKKRYVPDLFVFGCLICRTQSCVRARPRTRSPTHQLSPPDSPAGRLFNQLWSQRHLGVETHDPLRIHPASVISAD